jgi:hypothetical protein
VGIYAKSTAVPVERSKTQIERTLQRYGAGAFAYASRTDKAVIQFEMRTFRIRFDLPLPDRKQFETTKNGSSRPDHLIQASWDQACRQSWRALSLAILAKLEAVECGITTFEEEFLAHIVLPGGKTAGEWMVPQIAQAYETHKMPPLLEASKAVKS